MRVVEEALREEAKEKRRWTSASLGVGSGAQSRQGLVIRKEGRKIRAIEKTSRLCANDENHALHLSIDSRLLQNSAVRPGAIFVDFIPFPVDCFT